MLLKIGGWTPFLKQLAHQTYSRTVHVGVNIDLQNTEIPQVEAKVKYTLRLASKEDIDEVLRKAKTESKDMAQNLVYRRWLYEEGYHNCYIARTADTNEICFLQFIIYPEDEKLLQGRFRIWLPELKEDEAIIEGTYTFEKFRGNRLHPAITAEQLRICKSKGIKRVISYVEKNNLASLKGFERAGYTPFEEIYKQRILFGVRRRHNNRGHV